MCFFHQITLLFLFFFERFLLYSILFISFSQIHDIFFSLHKVFKVYICIYDVLTVAFEMVKFLTNTVVLTQTIHSFYNVYTPHTMEQQLPCAENELGGCIMLFDIHYMRIIWFVYI